MPISSATLAKAICENGEWKVSNLQLQKIAYMAHMVYMGRSRERLVDEAFEAWDYGPVLPNVYRRVKIFGSGPVGNVFHGCGPVSDPGKAAIVKEACDHLLKLSPGRLVAMTHWKDGAWAKNYQRGALNVVIPDSDILAEYRNRTNAIAG